MPKVELFRGLKDKTWLWLTLALGLVFRFTNISKASFWHDEGFTMMLAPMPIGEIITRTARDVHPPLYYLLLHIWTGVFGTSEIGARSLSALFGVITIAAVFFLVRRLFGSPAARTAALLVAAGPFVVRYSQEARMFALVAMLAAISTLLLVRWRQDRQDRDLILYVCAMTAALYSQYFAIFLVPVHWLYVLADSQQQRNWRQGLFSWRWWSANLAIITLFAPWLPVVYEQVTRIQGGFWIPKTTLATVPATLAQFLTFTDLGLLPLAFRLGLLVAFLVLTGITAWRHRQKLASWVLMSAYVGLAPLIVLVLSLKRPIYIDRYFVFSAVAFYALVGVLLHLAPVVNRYRPVRRVVTVTIVAILLFGVSNVYRQSDHAMRDTLAAVGQRFQAGDALVSGELYTWFDGSHYNRTGSQLLVYLPGDGYPGCCEGRSMLYDKPQLIVRDLALLRPSTGVVWVIGKTGPHDYFDNVPSHWQADGPRISNGYTAAQRYRLR